MCAMAAARPPMQIELLDRQRVGAAADALARGFQNDPLYSFVVPHAEHRRRWLPIFWRQILKTTQPLGHTYLAVDDAGQIGGVIALTPPGKFPHSWWSDQRMFWNILLRPLPWVPALRPLWPLKRYAEAFDAMHPADPHWYVDVLGVDLARQRGGIGRRLMGRAIELSRASGDLLWLETENVANVPYYESLGYVASERRDPVAGGPPTIGMRRDCDT